jgi:hypothetical protein
MFVLCVLHSKDKRHSQDNQDKEVVQMMYREQKDPGGGEILCIRPQRPRAHQASYAVDTGSLFRVYDGRVVALITQSHLKPRLKKE